MKIRQQVIWFIVVVAMLITLIVFLNHRPANTDSQPIETNSTSSSGTGLQTPVSPLKAGSALDTNTITRNAVSIPTPPSQPKNEQMREGLAKLNDEEIVLYGKVQDQFGAAVANATVSGIIQVNNGIRMGTDRTATITDGNGLFSISGYKGKNLGINVTKDGYVLAATNKQFIYSFLWPESQRFTPDQNNPTIIKMWKLQGAESLVGVGKEYRLPFTNAPLFFDLLTGSVSDNGGDLEIIITRATGLLSKRTPGDWSIEFKAVNGGLIETDYATSQVTYEAPANGYQDSYLVQMSRDDAAWYDNVEKVFFLKSRNGQVYSKLSFDFRINNEQNGSMWFQFKGVANTNNSRNWEATAPK